MNILILNPTIGADVELFLADKQTKEIVSAEGYIKGSKYEPYHFDPEDKFFSTSLDNVAAEVTIRPATTSTEFINNLKKSIDYVNNNIPERLCTVAQPAAILDDKYLQTENAKTFGCEPDYNVWIRGVNDKPEASNANLRSCGGHVHVGYTPPSDDVLQALNIESKLVLDEYIVKAMDLFLGVPSVLQEPDNDRKLLYGKAGAFRFKDYGVEYRTISNYYLNSEKLTEWVFNNTMKAIEFINNGRFEELDAVSEQIQEAINSNNKELAGNLIRQFQIELV